MKKLFSLFIFLILISLTAFSQYQKAIISPDLSARRLEIKPAHSQAITTVCSGITTIKANFPSWNSKLVHVEKKHSLSPEIQAQIDRKTAQKILNRNVNFQDESRSTLSSPKIGVSIEANRFDGYTPPDNSMAISNSGYIVSVINSNIEYYDNAGNFLSSSSFSDFFSDPSFTGNIYDPVVLYDSGSDRFFMVILHASTSDLSNVVACFSKSGNPTDGWYYYKLTGNPLSNGCWFDYPKVAVSNNEVYVTGNLFTDAGTFSEVVIYQINKADGYAGTNLTWQYWHGISESPFTLVPASFGQEGNYGPGLYLVSTEDDSDKIKFFDLTDDMTGTPEVKAYSVDATFAVAGDALQLGSTVVLNNDDARGLHAFYLNGIVHFTFHSDNGGGYAGLNYNRLTVSDLSLWSSTFGLDGYDYSYPAVASFGNGATDKSVIIGFLRSGTTIYPETRVVYCDDAGNWSGSTLVKEGETYVDVYASSNKTRWGDYSGVTRKQNAASPEVWVSGCYGHFRSNEHSYDSWVAQVKGIDIGIIDPTAPQIKASVYPNPVYDWASVVFEIQKNTLIEVSIMDLNGKIVRTIFKDMAKAGKNLFSFNKGALAAGTYFLNIQSSSKIMAHEKVVVQ